MDKNAIKKFAVWARRELISRVSQRAAYFEITEAGFGDPAADSVLGRVLSAEEKTQRQALISQIRQKGYQQVMEEVAYTWFNRFIALRFMEVNGYLPSHVRVFTDEANQFKPQILAEAIHMELDGLDMQKVYAFKNANDDDGLFKYMVIVQCNALSAILPGMFQRISDYTELLFPDNLLREGSVLQQMVELIPEEDWKDAVQIIGWLYQYYNAEKKDEVFAALKKNVKITKENIPAATQLFTPDWIVRYMVENSLGRLWVEGHPNDELKATWKYYLEEAEQESEAQAQLAEIHKEYAAMTPEQIKCIDPCCGSGHILAYLFDVLVQIYESYGYTTREAVASIVQNNLYGLDIDDRAAQLAYFAVMMKARQYDRRFFSRGIQPKVYAIQESNSIDSYDLDYFCNGHSKLKAAINNIITEMHDAKEYGSILNVTPVDFSALYARFDEVRYDIGMSKDSVLNNLLPLVEVAEALAKKYDVVVTNPPYMSNKGMTAKLSTYVQQYYKDGKVDMYAVFMLACRKMTNRTGYSAMITQHSWMFLSSQKNLRLGVYNNRIVNMVHLGPRAFEEIGGEVVQTTSFVVSPARIEKYISNFVRLVSFAGQEEKRQAFFDNRNRLFTAVNFFREIPDAPLAYWLSEKAADVLRNNRLFDDVAKTRAGMITGNNEMFVRLWHEVSYTRSKYDCKSREEGIRSGCRWFPYSKGGEFRKWYGNNDCVVNWENDGSFMRNYKDEKGNIPAHAFNLEYIFKDNVCWNSLSSNRFSARYTECGYLYDAGGSFASLPGGKSKQYLGFLNSCVAFYYLSALNPTMNFQKGNVGNLPIVQVGEENANSITNVVDECITMSRNDWDSYENSWDFVKHPLVCPASTIADVFEQWKAECNDCFKRLRGKEKELNRIFIDIYGLQDELTPEVADKDVTVHYVVDTKDDIPASLQGSSYVLTRRDVIVSLISYAVGCMFGRYSLDVEGLAYAGGDWNAVYRIQQEIYAVEGKEVHLADGRVLTVKPAGYNQIKTDDGWKNLSYPVDADNVIPICDDEYFDDDMVGRFVKFIETVYGSDTLEENLKFIADALGGKGTPRDVIRSYFLDDFYADHCKTYQKRPIYWLFDSGKKNGFKALIYMHRYQPDTIARIRTDYVHEQQSRYRTAIADLESRIAAASTAERVKLNKQLKRLQEQDAELRTYEEKIHHLADKMTPIDLDDGVKVNYAKFQDVLAKIK